MRLFGLSVDESYKGKPDCDEWGTAELIVDDLYGVDYNYCFDNGASCSAMYFMFFNGEFWEDATELLEHYDIEWDKPDWKERLEKNMNRFYDECVKEANKYAWKK